MGEWLRRVALLALVKSARGTPSPTISAPPTSMPTPVPNPAPTDPTPTPTFTQAPNLGRVPKRSADGCFSSGYWAWAYAGHAVDYDDDASTTWPQMYDDSQASSSKVGCQSTRSNKKGNDGVKRDYNRAKLRNPAAADDGNDWNDDWKTGDTTECFIGNELYSTEMAFCDMKCATADLKLKVSDGWGDDDGNLNTKQSHPYSAICAGPWYCSKTKICVDAPYANEARKCTYVYGCANATQCTTNDGEYIDIAAHTRSGKSHTYYQSERRSTHVAVQREGGLTMKTWCCENNYLYDHTENLPCNAASGVFQRVLLLVAPLTAALFVVLSR